MVTQDEMLERIEAQENKARSLGAKLWRQRAEVKTTQLLAKKSYKQNYGEETVISPALWTKISFILALGVLVFMGYLIRQNLASEPLLVRFIFGGFLGLGLIGMIVWLVSVYLFGPQPNGSIKINSKGIEIKNQLYKWQDTSQTCIVTQPHNRGDAYWLIIGLHDGKINRYDLSQFMDFKERLGLNDFDVRIADAIEHYKQKRK